MWNAVRSVFVVIALVTGVWAMPAQGAASAAPGHCCETPCRDMQGCPVQAGCAPCAVVPLVSGEAPALARPQPVHFARPAHERTPPGPARVVWTPPD